MRRFTLALATVLTLTLAVFSPVSANSPQESCEITVSGSGTSSLHLNFDLGNYRLIETEESGRTYHTIEYYGTGEVLTAGMPQLPSLSRLILIPENANVRLRIGDLTSRSLERILLEKYLPEGLPPGTEVNDAGEYLAFPDQIVTISEPVNAGGVTFCTVDIFPFRYNGTEGRLEVIEHLEFEIEITGGLNSTQSHTRSQKRFISGLDSHLLNPEAGQLDDMGVDPGEYLIVLPNAGLQDVFATFIEWKTQKGFNVTTADFEQIGTTAGDLLTYLQNAYDNWENRPQYVLLAGDIDGEIALPSFYYLTAEQDSAPADHRYSLLEGADYFADVEIGRIPVQSEEELTTILTKIIAHESDPWLPSGYLDRGFMAADSSSKYSASVKEWAKGLMLDYGYEEVAAQYFFSYMSIPEMLNTLNQGRGIFNYRGWSDWGGLTAANVRNLANIGEMPIVFGCAGGTNDFRLEESIGEAFIRTGAPDDLRGGVASVGPSDPNTYGKWDGTIDQGMMWGLYHENMETLSPVLNRGKLELWLSFPWNRGTGYTYNSVECYFHIYNVLGDPSLQVWRGLPGELTVNHPDSLPAGQNYIDIEILSGGQTVEGAVAVLSQGTEVIATVVSGISGTARLIYPEWTEGEVVLTVSGGNNVPYSSTISIVSAPAYLGFADFELDDDQSGFSSGNGDGNFNPGETVELTLSLFNFGTVPVESASALISSSCPAVEVVEPYAFFGNFGPWSFGQNEVPFVLSAGSQMDDGEEIIIDVTATGYAGEDYTSAFSLEIFAPEMTVESITFTSSSVDTVLFPGESSPLGISIANTGGLGWETLNCTARLDFEGITLEDSLAVFPACLPGETVDNQADLLQLSIIEELYPGFRIPVTLIFATETGLSDTAEFTFLAGIPTFMDPVVPQDGYGYYCFDDRDVSYLLSPDFDWKEVDPDFGGSGILVELTDEQAFEGDNAVIDLPGDFSFRYYGEDVSQLTICSNGWIAPGVTAAVDYLNKPIPSAGNPAGIIAPFWDDLLITDGGEVYYYYNQNDDWLVIEWSRVRSVFENTLETFEVILYDADTHQTPTGDSPIAFHYLTVEDVDEYNDFCTVGLLNPDATAGLQYVYSTLYASGAAILENERTLLFTTDPGGRVDPPELSFSPASFDFTAAVGQQDSSYLIITNMGDADLEYELSAGLWSMDNSGGPDQFGYIWVDSDEPWGNEFNWIDISTIGLEINFPHNDSTSADLPFGFTFPFYDQSFESIIVSANGWCSFTSHSSAWNNSSLPNNSAPENLVAAFWDDLDPLDGGDIYIWSNQLDSLIVSFHAVEHYGTTNGTYTYQVILEANGHIAFQYRLMEGVVNSGTAGIQNWDKSIGLQVLYNQNYLHDDMRVDIQNPWLSISPMSGEINGSESDSVRLTADAGYLLAGTYRTEVTLLSNDPFQVEPIIIPVSLNVTEAANFAEGLTVSVSEAGLVLEWNNSTDYSFYRIYRSEEPYFVIGDAVMIGETAGNTFTDVAAFSGDRYFYKVAGY